MNLTKKKSRIIAAILLVVGSAMIAIAYFMGGTTPLLKLVNSTGVMLDIVAAFMFISSDKLAD